MNEITDAVNTVENALTAADQLIDLADRVLALETRLAEIAEKSGAGEVAERLEKLIKQLGGNYGE